jgi:hypothetical protein
MTGEIIFLCISVIGFSVLTAALLWVSWGDEHSH